jgi:hypothetical protein
VTMLNRSVAIIRLKEPFFKWVKTLPDPADVSKDIINHDTTAYLLPAIIYDSEEAELLQQFYDLIFEEQLNGWWKEKSDWPKKRDMTTFKKWFDVEFHSLVLDLVDAPLQDDE